MTATDSRIQRVTMPKWGLSMTRGKITEWLVGEGDPVRPGMDLAEIETDKIAGTLESAAEGVLRRLVVTVGTEVPVSGTIAVVAPAEVPEADIDRVVEAARAELASGAVEEPAGASERVLAVGGRSLAYAVAGDTGETLVLVHGFGGDKGSWLFVQEPLAEGRTVYALDLPGHGSSSKDVGDGSLDTLGAVLVEFLRGLDLPPVHLVGHSLGAAVATAAAGRAPDLVRSLTLVAPAGLGSAPDVDYLRGFVTAASRRDLKPLLGRLFADEDLVSRQMVEDLLRYKRLDGVTAALTALLGTLLDGDRQAIDLREALRALPIPVAIVWGTRDRILPAVDPDTLDPAWPVRLVDGAGHLVHLERPGAVRDVVVEAIGRA